MADGGCGVDKVWGKDWEVWFLSFCQKFIHFHLAFVHRHCQDFVESQDDEADVVVVVIVVVVVVDVGRSVVVVVVVVAQLFDISSSGFFNSWRKTSQKV